MKILIAGASGVIGRRLVPVLVARGHQVVGTSRSEARSGELRALGAQPRLLDALDGRAVDAVVEQTRPDVIVHQLTALSGPADLKHFDRAFAQTNRLRTMGTDNLLRAALAAGVGRFVAQSYTGWPNARSGAWVKSEQDPLDPDPTPASRQTLAAIHHVEQVVPNTPGVAGIVLRYGTFYGPGTSFALDGDVVQLVRQRKLPVVGGGAGVWSFVHVDDAAEATALAVESDATGLFNIVDDDPAPVHRWLPELAATLDARPPRKVPAWLARPLIGEHGVAVMTQCRGSSNAKARHQLGWKPEYASWREGFQDLTSAPGG